MLIDGLEGELILLFGWYGKGTGSGESDVDIGYYWEKKVWDYEGFLVAGEVGDLWNVEVDLGEIREVDTVFGGEIF